MRLTPGVTINLIIYILTCIGCSSQSIYALVPSPLMRVYSSPNIHYSPYTLITKVRKLLLFKHGPLVLLLIGPFND